MRRCKAYLDAPSELDVAGTSQVLRHHIHVAGCLFWQELLDCLGASPSHQLSRQGPKFRSCSDDGWHSVCEAIRVEPKPKDPESSPEVPEVPEVPKQMLMWDCASCHTLAYCFCVQLRLKK